MRITPKARTQVRQDQIAQATLALVARGGLAKLSMAAVARHVGLVPSAIYRHYRGKEEMVDAALGLVGRRLLENVAAVGRLSPDPVEQLRLLLERHVQLIQTHQGIVRIVFFESMHAGHPARREQIHGIITGYLRAVAGIIRQGQAAGRIRPEADGDVLALMFLGLVQPAAILWDLSGGRFRIDHHITKAWQVFRRAIETTPYSSDDGTPSGGGAAA